MPNPHRLKPGVGGKGQGIRVVRAGQRIRLGRAGQRFSRACGQRACLGMCLQWLGACRLDCACRPPGI